jgi:hypothetical protein
MKKINSVRYKAVLVLALLFLMPDIYAQNATVNVRIHISRTSNGTDPSASQADANRMINILDAAYAAANIDFHLCGIYYLDDNNYHTGWDPYDNAHDENDLIVALGNNYKKYTLNIFVTDLKRHLHGHSNWPEDFMDLIEIDKDNIFQTTLPHEVGHYFGLLHTRDHQFGYELADGTNSSVAGDMIADTPAEPATVDDDWNNFVVKIANSSDDAEERVNSRAVSLGSSDLELTEDGNNQQLIGMRFAHVYIPQGTNISNAYIQFETDEVSNGDCRLTIKAEDVGNSVTFNDNARNISNRVRTNTSKLWRPAAWNNIGDRDDDQKTSDISDVIQEVINRNDFVSGNAITCIINGVGRRTAVSYDNRDAYHGRPALHIETNNGGLYSGRDTDDNGDRYNPDGKNFMSDAPAEVRSHFSAGQNERINAVLNLDRYYLKFNNCNPIQTGEDVTLHADDNEILTIRDFPHTESFDRNANDSWMSDMSKDFGWTYGANTPTRGTGASSAQDGNYFRFIWASKFTGTAGLISPCYDLEDYDNANVTFYYNMYGTDMGTLKMEVSTDNGANWVGLYTRRGAQNNDGDWSEAVVDLNNYVGQKIQLRITGTSNGEEEGDISIDHITVNATVDDNDDGGNDDNNQNSTFSIQTESDDAEESANTGDMNLSSSDLELVDESGRRRQLVGMRFANINIPQGTNIVSAYIQFWADDANDGACNLNIQAEDIDNSATFTNDDNNISNRIRTNASVNWQPDRWVKHDEGEAQRTPDIKNVIQEVVDRNGFDSGNAITIIITGSGEREAGAFRNGHSPVLHITTGPAEVANGSNSKESDIKFNTIEEELNSKEIKLYPNPVKSTLYIDGLIPQTTINIISVKGAVVKTLKVNGRSDRINVSDLKNGIYLIRYNNGSSYKVKRFIKE